MIVCAFGIVFVYLFISLVWKKLGDYISRHHLFSGVNITEVAVYAVLAILAITLAVIMYTKTEMVYGTDFTGDVVFSSDSNVLFKDRVWVIIPNSENDIRQPLFSVFALPFCGIAYLITGLFNLPTCFSAVIIDIPQICLLIFSFFIHFFIKQTFSRRNKKAQIISILSQ